jgi:single-stranded DNA-binding protein
VGEIATECEFSHDVFGEDFYTFKLLVPRKSEANDLLPITISERIMEGSRFIPGELIAIVGQIRSYNNYIEKEGRNRLVLTVFAKDYEFFDSPDFENLSKLQDTPDFQNAFDFQNISAFHNSPDFQNPNDVFLDGYICKPPIYRTTPFGREIADLLLAVNRSYNKSDYIPCITWGRNARFGAKLEVGDNIRIWGRMQSRLYQKKLDDDNIVEKTAYEVSVSRLENVIDD